MLIDTAFSLPVRRVGRHDNSRQRLLQLREELESVAATGAEAAQVVELDQTKVGRLSRMDALQAQAMSMASGERRKSLLNMIAAALQRIDDNTYGHCLQCDDAINPRRLEVDPTASLCIDCACRSEQK